MPTPKKSKTEPEKNSDATMDDLQAKLADLSDKATVIENTAKAEKRSLTPEEVKEVKELQTAFAEVEEEISALEASAAMRAKIHKPGQRETLPVDNAAEVDDDEGEQPRRPARSITGGMPSGATKSKLGLPEHGRVRDRSRDSHQARAGRHAHRERAETYGQEAVAADGGFAVPPDFREEIMKQVEGEESLISRCDQQTPQEQHPHPAARHRDPWDTRTVCSAGGAGRRRRSPPAKPKLGALETKLNKLTALVPLTDEMLEDVPAMTRWLESKVPEKFTSTAQHRDRQRQRRRQAARAAQLAVKVTVAAKSGQGAGTVVAKNATTCGRACTRRCGGTRRGSSTRTSSRSSRTW
jgi:HK97 family phage major capsid protein